MNNDEHLPNETVLYETVRGEDVTSEASRTVSRDRLRVRDLFASSHKSSGAVQEFPDFKKSSTRGYYVLVFMLPLLLALMTWTSGKIYELLVNSEQRASAESGRSKDGGRCQVTQVPGGANISCADGTSAVIKDREPTSSSPRWLPL